jgi:endonuclease III
VATGTWKRPTKRRVRAIRDRLRELYGRPTQIPHGRPVEELVRTILSQNTNDTNRDVAFERLRARFPTWEAVRDAPLGEVEDAIRPGGLAPQKAPRIQAALQDITDRAAPGREAEGAARIHSLNLDWLKDAPRDEAMDFLTSLPGVGRKTAACVLIFSFGRPEIPVDTHVYRVGGRLGLFPPDASFERAHNEMRTITDPDDAYELHINLITHGRRVCRPRPRCEECALRRMCPYWRALPRSPQRRRRPDPNLSSGGR